MPELEKSPVSDVKNLIEAHLEPDALIYEHLTDVPDTPKIFLFNNGHVTRQLQPHLQELVTEYGAKFYKIKTAGPKSYLVFAGIEPQELLRFVTKNINPGEVEDILLNFLIGITEPLPLPSLKKLMQERAAGRVNTETVQQIIFGLRQQLGQRNNPDTYVELAEQAIEQQRYESAEKALDSLQKTFRSMSRQYRAGLIFFQGLQEFLLQPGNRQRFAGHSSLIFELQNTEEMLRQIEDLLTQETIYQLRADKMRNNK